jgi:haloalkane dehalogenase
MARETPPLHPTDRSVIVPQANISAHDPYERQTIAVLDSEMSYIDTGSGDAIVFLHGNPTSSYLWRNIIPAVVGVARCLAPDLIGMGQSGKSGDGSYRFVDHRRYLDAWLDAVDPGDRITFVIHDWGSALGADWAMRHPDRVKGIVYMEALFQPRTWEQWPEIARNVFQGFRSPAGEVMILEKNIFVERVLHATGGGLADDVMEVYRRPYLEPGESRRPTLTWPREIPIDGEPADMVTIVGDVGQWMAANDLPKLFIHADPGAILQGEQLAFCRTFANQREVEVEGTHFIQEEQPAAISAALADWYATL